MSFSRPILHEEAEGFHKESTLIKKNDELSLPEPGRIGWQVFKNTNLFLDLRNSKIAFCDSLSTLKKEGYSIEAFAKTHLLMDRGLVEFEATTSKGHLRCMLDTGATWNILNTEIEDERSIEQVAQEPANLFEFSFFEIGNQDLGPIAFHRIPIKLPMQVEALLGMEFFREHLVFLDFAENTVYFSKEGYPSQ